MSDSKEKFENTITISSDSEPSTQKSKPRRLTGIEKSFKQAPVFTKRKRKKDFYVAEFGSDFEDNFLSDDSSDNSNTSDDSVEILDESRLTLNVSEPVNPISRYNYIIIYFGEYANILVQNTPPSIFNNLMRKYWREGARGGRPKHITLRKIQTLLKHNLELLKNPDFLFSLCNLSIVKNPDPCGKISTQNIHSNFFS